MTKVKMTELSKRAMSAREMNALTGGNSCTCGCHGPSSTQDNTNANYNSNLHSKNPTMEKTDVLEMKVTITRPIP